MPDEVPQLRTVGVMAEEVNTPVGRVSYLVRKLGIKPIGRAGVLRLYDRTAVEAIRIELERVASKANSNG